MKSFFKHLAIAAAATLLGGSALAQGSSEYKSGIKIPLDEKGTKYIRFITWNQMWARSVQNNPGTASIEDPTKEQKTSSDIGIRRARALWIAQISPRYLVLTHIGINNQTFNSGGGIGATGVGGYGTAKKPQIFFHDFWNEYRVLKQDGEVDNNGTKTKFEKNTLFIGAGLHYWNGVSRMASASTLNFLAVDAPVWNWYNIEFSDQFARQFGVYAKGKIAKHLDYRFHINKPFIVDQTTGATATVKQKANLGNAAFAPTDKFAYGGYVNWQFWDQEANVLPFFVGTYAGTKKVFNIGAGFYHHKNALATYDSLATGYDANKLKETRLSQNVFGVDVFLDRPLGEGGKNGAITLYALYQNSNFGKNFWRNVGIMNVNPNSVYKSVTSKNYAWVNQSTGDSLTKTQYNEKAVIEGYGNNRVLLGTGSQLLAEVGYLLPKNALGEKFGNVCRVQPFFVYSTKNLERFKDGAGSYIDGGCNFFLDGHHAKITLEYSTRSIHNLNYAKIGTKGEFIIQAQVYL